MTTIEFHLYHDMTHLGSIYYSDQVGDKSGEYVPLSEHQALQTHANLLAKEVYDLRGLLRRVVEIGPELFDNIEVYENHKTPQLIQLLRNCKEAIK